MFCIFAAMMSLTPDPKMFNFIASWELIKTPQKFVHGSFFLKSLKLCHTKYFWVFGLRSFLSSSHQSSCPTLWSRGLAGYYDNLKQLYYQHAKLKLLPTNVTFKFETSSAQHFRSLSKSIKTFLFIFFFIYVLIYNCLWRNLSLKDASLSDI